MLRNGANSCQSIKPENCLCLNECSHFVRANGKIRQNPPKNLNSGLKENDRKKTKKLKNMLGTNESKGKETHDRNLPRLYKKHPKKRLQYLGNDFYKKNFVSNAKNALPQKGILTEKRTKQTTTKENQNKRVIIFTPSMKPNRGSENLKPLSN